MKTYKPTKIFIDTIYANGFNETDFRHTFDDCGAMIEFYRKRNWKDDSRRVSFAIMNTFYILIDVDKNEIHYFQPEQRNKIYGTKILDSKWLPLNDDTIAWLKNGQYKSQQTLGKVCDDLIARKYIELA